MRKEKQLLLDEVQGKLENSKSFVFTRYLGLSSNNANVLRTRLANTGAEMEVVRKRIFVKAALAAGYEIDLKALEGHIGIVFAGEDAVETVKSVISYGTETAGQISVIGGVFDGAMCTAAQIEKLSKLPNKDGMRSQLLATLEAPMSQTLAVMEALLSSVVYCLDNKVKASAECVECAENAETQN